MAKNIYKEEQRFHDWVVIILLSLAVVGLLYGAASYFWRPESTIVYSIVCLLLAGGISYTIWWLTNMRYKLKVTDKKIQFKMKGAFTKSSKKIAWDDIVSFTLVKTPGIAKFQRPSAILSDEKFYSLDGRNGIVIETKDGNHYFIGCSNVEELQAALNSKDNIWEVSE